MTDGVAGYTIMDGVVYVYINVGGGVVGVACVVGVYACVGFADGDIAVVSIGGDYYVHRGVVTVTGAVGGVIR